ncbi:MAG TPA: HlyD family efflux transporter periplasmic adaptor subunit [Anaeromyxobacteraceae bacterium]|nr:HlyD family efflux transporter periplasmic adaptor subunit [Anaeromyxobacteraceae bacterium]
MLRISVLLVVAVTILAGLLAWRLHAQAETARGPAGGAGEIEGTEVEVSSRLEARVLEQHVRKGERVSKGDLLVVLDCADQNAVLGEALARCTAARAQAVAARASVDAARRSREASAAAGLAAKAQAAAVAAQRDAAVRQATRLESLSSDVAFSNRDQTRASAEGLQHQARAALAQAAASEEQTRAALAAIEASGAQAVAADAQLKATEASEARARLLADECLVRAPRDGVVDELPHEVGELVGAGQPLVKLVDLAEVKATLYLPNAELAAARPNGKAIVLADAWPSERFVGVVQTVKTKAEFTPRNIQTRTDRDRLVYAIEVRIQNREARLRPGMPVQVQLTGAEH